MSKYRMLACENTNIITSVSHGIINLHDSLDIIIYLRLQNAWSFLLFTQTVVLINHMTLIYIFAEINLHFLMMAGARSS